MYAYSPSESSEAMKSESEPRDSESSSAVLFLARAGLLLIGLYLPNFSYFCLCSYFFLIKIFFFYSISNFILHSFSSLWLSWTDFEDFGYLLSFWIGLDFNSTFYFGIYSYYSLIFSCLALSNFFFISSNLWIFSYFYLSSLIFLR